MKPSFYKILFDQGTPFRCTYIDVPRFNHPLHYHPEIELTLIVEGDGIRHIGDNTSNFGKGDLVLIGSNLPHRWKNEEDKYPSSRSRRITLQFPNDFMNGIFRYAEELAPVAQLFRMADRGIQFSKNTGYEIEPLLMEIHQGAGLQRWISVFELLQKLVEADNFKILASPISHINSTNKETDRMGQIFQHVKNNIENKITLEEVADIACLTKPSFCRLFKQKTGKSFILFLNEFRINYAKRMMMQDKDMTIGQIAQKSGFNSIQHFNTKFKEFNEGLNPSQYLKAL